MIPCMRRLTGVQEKIGWENFNELDDQLDEKFDKEFDYQPPDEDEMGDTKSPLRKAESEPIPLKKQTTLKDVVMKRSQVKKHMELDKI